MKDNILNTSVDACQDGDCVLWSTPPNGQFCQRATYEELMSHLPPKPQFSLAWSKWNVLKHSFANWQLLSDSLPTKDRIVKHGITAPSSCSFCQTSGENARHLFFNCPFTTTLWSKVKTLVGMNTLVNNLEAEWFYIIQIGLRNHQLSAMGNNSLNATIYAI